MSDNLYHDHLDVCKECREEVLFSKCPEGARLLKLQATGVDSPPVARRPSLIDGQFDALMQTLASALK